MLRTASLTLLALGCHVSDPGPERAPEPQPTPAPSKPAQPQPQPDLSIRFPDACRPDPATARRLFQVAGATENSLHELVACGGAQAQTAQSMVLVVLLSNDAFFEASTLDDLSNVLGYVGGDPTDRFEQLDDGRWRMATPGGTSFWLRFLDPVDDSVLQGNLFELESYLEGAWVETSLTWEQMLQTIDRKNTYTLTWDAPGPHAELLFPEGLPEPATVELELSLIDFAWLLGWALGPRPDFGPFERLTDLGMDSAVHLRDARGGVDVTYEATGRRGTLADIAGGSGVGFEFDGLDATDGAVSMHGTGGGLDFVGGNHLAGVVRYTTVGVEPPVDVEHDFGAGSSYPTTRFLCP